MAQLIRGDVPDLTQAHREEATLVGGSIHSIFYNIETIKRKIADSGSFEEYMKTTPLYNHEELILKHEKGAI